MGLWSSLVDGVKSLGSGISTGAKWVWNNASLARVSWGVFTYTTDTIGQLFEQGLALRKAIPTLINNPAAKKVASGMWRVFAHNVLPVLALTIANKSLQPYLDDSNDFDGNNEPSSLNALINTPVSYVVLYLGAESFVRMMILDSVGPPAFNSNKTTPPPSLCIEQKCNAKREAKGMFREPFILIANDALIGWVGLFSSNMARFLDIIIKGRYITRMATPERCERHKAMEPASVLSLGLAFETTKLSMDYMLVNYIGMPSGLIYYPIYRTMEHLLLLLHTNIAAHMELPLVKESNSVAFDPVTAYEWIVRFVLDVQISGLKDRVPKDFKPKKDAKPWVPLSPVLRGITSLINSDLEQETRVKPGMLRQSLNKLSIFIPPMYQGVDGFLNDTITKMYWPVIRSGGIFATDIILSVEQNKAAAATVKVLAWMPKTVSSTVNFFTGIPKTPIRLVLNITKKEDFYALVRAVKLWFERHDLECKVTLIEQPNNVILYGDKELLPVPDVTDEPPVAPMQQLLTDRSKEDAVVTVSELLPIERKQITNSEPAESEPVANASDLIPVRRRSLAKEVSVTENLDSLFTTRKRKSTNVMQASTSSVPSR